ncbi:L,D-transpeptidase [Pseudoroseicyclus aestuarii]|uniref:L,D-transpeptidase-like protein n=1 Tax=Pseudoroseicyclus aestuarii TaxID=1795041 RepID=A0A318T8L7_9RHOB|nr:L,D-transpeptidase [Pseudoroseicyclus aestuarii]PYE84718.1 L,D-transpeptidase-like protein [Pseudoroseicyclus aestuarii]
MTGSNIGRRAFLAGGAAAAGLAAAPAAAQVMSQRPFDIPESWRPRVVDINADAPAGLIYVDTAERRLYWTLGEGRAIRYLIAVGAAGRNFQGEARVGRKAEWPRWTPTRNMIRAEPEVYGPYAGGLPGGHEWNPLGARALYMYQGNRDTMYRIHGTPQPWTMGQSFSSGCIRLVNEHAMDLYSRVPVGTRVVVS